MQFNYLRLSADVVVIVAAALLLLWLLLLLLLLCCCCSEIIVVRPFPSCLTRQRAVTQQNSLVGLLLGAFLQGIQMCTGYALQLTVFLYLVSVNCAC